MEPFGSGGPFRSEPEACKLQRPVTHSAADAAAHGTPDPLAAARAERPSASLRIGERSIGADAPVYVIAEIGSNHDGELSRALALIALAAEAGADAVKFQSFSADGLSRRGEPAHPILERLALPPGWHAPLRDAAQRRGLHFLSTPFDEASASLLAAEGTPAIKVASGDLTHAPLLAHVAALGLPVLLSTGLATLEEVDEAVTRLRRACPALPLGLLHCVASYPPVPAEWNLRAIPVLAARFGCVVGLSDHSPGHTAAVGAVALGARVVEKHLTDDCRREGPDHAYALDGAAFADLVAAVRELEQGLGDGAKRAAPSEQAGLRLGRRSLHAAAPIAAGAVIEGAMLKVVRPADGLAPGEVPRVLGRRAARDIAPDEPITAELLR